MFDLIIPCLFSHIGHLEKTLNSFHHQDLISQIIIVINDIKNKKLPDDFLLKYQSKLNLILLENKTLPGIARSIGLKHATSDYIVFHDADDEAHPDKLLILKKCFDKYECDHILHLIQPIELDFLKYDLENLKIVDTEKIMLYYQKTKKCDFGDIIEKRCSQGLCAVRRNKVIDIEWLNIASGEDKDFNLKSLLKGNKLILLDAYLSKYDRYKLKIMKRYHPKAWGDFVK
jgi:glycosyltransferase involved in cell wall biosynthesis